jgi:molecular chaperone GrpE
VAEKDQDQPQAEQPVEQEEAATGSVDSREAPVSEPGEEGPGDAAGEEVSLDETLVQLRDEAAAAKDLAMRAQAEAQNVKRRAEQEVEKARKFALEQFTRELLPVVDNLERALEAAAGGGEGTRPIAEGVELTLKSFRDVMAKFNIEPVDPQGEPFDPNLHQAMSTVENNEVEPNSVIAVIQKGYTLNGRLMRPAMVMVSKSGD